MMSIMYIPHIMFETMIRIILKHTEDAHNMLESYKKLSFV